MSSASNTDGGNLEFGQPNMFMLNEASTKAVVARFWEGALDEAPNKADSEALLNDILTRYSAPDRHYHNLVHITKMLMFLIDEISDQASLNELVLAAIFHDVIYDPQRSDNEEQSALMAEVGLRPLGFSDDVLQRIRTLIMCTKTHQVVWSDINSLTMIDADLLILGAPAEEYDEYAQAIRQEYSFVSDHDYRVGRPKVLQRFLERASVYLTPRLEAEFGSRARENMRREIERLTVSG